MPSGKNHLLTVAAIGINTNLRCQRIYPVEDERSHGKTLAQLKTVGITLTRDQALHMARLLIVATQEWERVTVTAFRRKSRRTGTYPLTITTPKISVAAPSDLSRTASGKNGCSPATRHRTQRRRAARSS